MLGASNLSRGLPSAVSLALSAIEGPLAIYVAKGHGRSYGRESSFLGKKISGISQCGIWSALDGLQQVSTTAWVTDVGNDLAYEVPVDAVMEWVTMCVDLLLTYGASVVISDLPVDAIQAVGATRYRALRTVFFPSCRLSWTNMLDRVELLSRRLRELAESRNIPVFIGRSEWYGWDPMHPRRPYLDAIWRNLFETAGLSAGRLPSPECSIFLRWYLRGLRPQRWSTLARARCAEQPDGLLRDGTSIALY